MPPPNTEDWGQDTKGTRKQVAEEPKEKDNQDIEASEITEVVAQTAEKSYVVHSFELMWLFLH